MPAKPKYEDLQLAAFRLRTDVPWERRLYLLRFPESWKKPLTALAKPRRNGEEIRSIPIALLNDVIAALVPDVITVATRATIGENAPWIYSDVEVDTESLFLIIATWVRATATDPRKADAILSKLHHSELDWTPLNVDFTTLTSDTEDRIRSTELYRLLPHVIAAELSAPDLQHVHLMPKDPDADSDDEPTEVEQVISRFHRTPSEEGACVMNWPPHRMPQRPLSYMINITAQSRAFGSQPLIHLSVGTRRWAHKEAKLSFSHGHSVYMLPSLPWLPGLNQSRSFLVASIESWKKEAPDTDDGFEYSARWAGGKIGKILRELGLTDDGKLPDPEVLKQTPARYLAAPNAAALVYSNGMYPFDHPVAPGTSLADKVPIVNWVTNTLADRLVPVEPLRKGAKTVLDLKKLKESKFAASEAAQLRQSIADTIGDTLGVDIFYDTTHTKNYARATLAKLLGIEVPEDTDRLTGKPETITTEELTVLITVRRIGAWGGGLAGDTAITDKDRFQAAVHNRIDKIAEELGDTEVPTISLVEIKGRRSYSGKQRTSDPKFAIKAGLSRTGRLTQCVTEAPEPTLSEDDQEAPTSDSSLEKMRFSWYDLLRQLGVRTADLPVQLEGTTVHEAPAYLAFWLIRQNQRSRWEGITRQVPVAVLIDPTGRHIQVCAPNVRWAPLHRAQHEISRHHMLTDQKRTPEEITRFFEQVLRSVARQYPSLLLLTSAQNLRWGWPHLNNPDMAIDTIKFGQHPQDITRYPGLRHVRLRTTERDEVPDTWAVNSKEEGHAPGYWPDENRIFFSTGEKPRSASNAVKSASKVVPRWRKGQLVNPSTKSMVWNARALELTAVAIQPGDDPEEWAALVHDLRWATPHYEYSISLPWPLSVAKQIAQYIMPLDLLEDVEEIEAGSSSPWEMGNRS